MANRARSTSQVFEFRTHGGKRTGLRRSSETAFISFTPAYNPSRVLSGCSRFSAELAMLLAVSRCYSSASSSRKRCEKQRRGSCRHCRRVGGHRPSSCSAYSAVCTHPHHPRVRGCSSRHPADERRRRISFCACSSERRSTQRCMHTAPVWSAASSRTAPDPSESTRDLSSTSATRAR